MNPIRMQLSRRKGFNLQTLSQKFNGLDAVNVSRPGRWGNPFTVSERISAGGKTGGGQYIAVPTIEDAIACYREMLDQRPEMKIAAVEELRGKNLGCWCRLSDSCHADVLLEVANSEHNHRTNHQPAERS